MRENKKGGALSKVQKLKKRLSQSFGKLGKKQGNMAHFVWVQNPWALSNFEGVFACGPRTKSEKRKSKCQTPEGKSVCRTKGQKIFTKESYLFVSVPPFFDQHFTIQRRNMLAVSSWPTRSWLSLDSNYLWILIYSSSYCFTFRSWMVELKLDPLVLFIPFHIQKVNRTPGTSGVNSQRAVAISLPLHCLHNLGFWGEK